MIKDIRMYEKDGKKYPSVTSILKLITYDETLMNWANHMGFMKKNIKDVSKTSTSFGTMVHDRLEEYLLGKEINVSKFNNEWEANDVMKIINEFKKYFQNIKYETIFIEKTYISHKLKYAGTLDWFAKLHDNENRIYYSLIDFKTSKRVYHNYLLQLGAYYNLIMDDEETILKPNLGGIIIMNRDIFKLHPINIEKIQYYGQVFNILYALFIEMYNIENNTSMDYHLLSI